MNRQSQKGEAPNPALVYECLERVLSSPPFEKSPRQQDLLRYLVKETLSGNAERLKGYTLGVELFGRGVDFDPTTDAIVRVEVGRLRTKLREYYTNSNQADAVKFDLPKGGYVIYIALLDQQQTPQPVAQAIADSSVSWPSSMAHEVTLAVLPFTNMSMDPEQDYFVDGITDNLIYELSKLSSLLVVSRQSSFHYRGTTKPSGEIGKALGVAYLLEGGVQRSNQRVRVTANLISANNGNHIWSQRFDSDMQDIFALQDEVALNVVKALQIRLAPAEAELFGHEGTTNIEAHDALLRGMERYWKYTPKHLAEARAYYVKAVELDTSYAAAHAWLTRTYIFQWTMKWDTGLDLREKGLAHAQKAIELDNKLAFAYSMLGYAHMWLKHGDEAIAAGRQAVALDPNNYESLHFLSLTLGAAGHGEEALFYIEKAQRYNPHASPSYEFTLGLAHYVLKNYDKAIEIFKRGCALSATFPPNHVFLCTTLALMGKNEEMLTSREIFLSIMGGDLTKLPHLMWIDEELNAEYQKLIQITGLYP